MFERGATVKNPVRRTRRLHVGRTFKVPKKANVNVFACADEYCIYFVPFSVALGAEVTKN